MARPFPNTFEQESPMTPQSASSISYQTNVNRQKTKKWTEAKPVNYGGDDWGDDDEYDAPPPPPISKPTGFRQQGQGLQTASKPESPAYDNAKKYGELPPLPGVNDPRGRRNSFDADDEKRDFSSATMRQPSPATTTPTASGPATRFSQITGVPAARNPNATPALSIQTQQPHGPTGIRKGSQGVSPVSESPHPEILLPGRITTGESSIVSPNSGAPLSASDFHARRDFSPSAVPQPLASRASPAPQSATDSPSARFPARKSSLSQSAGPALSEITRPSPAESTPKPWVAGRSASPGASAKSPSTPSGKALPFIRPADIYRRAEEERRQSLESGRPSMDSITGARASDRSDSPAMPQLKEKSSSDSLRGTGRRRTSFEGDDGSESGRRLAPMLEPVRERKSEYGFEGFNIKDHTPQSGPVPSTEPGHSAPDEDVDEEEEARRLSISPKLPDLTRISGFGMDMFSQPRTETAEPASAKAEESTPTAPKATPSHTDDDRNLRTQPSFGFRTLVHQAFDRSDDTSVPATPASHSSGVRRTDSESTGTTGISPIMSRVPSGAVPETRNRDISNTSILEVVNEPDSPETPMAQQPEETRRGREMPSFTHGYRQDISKPRSEASPARTPELAKAKIITSGHQAVVSEASPEADSTVVEPLQPPRPIAEREGSFRPSLPGGWTSYATTAQSDNPSQAPSVKVQTPAREVSPVRDETEITPTAKKHVEPIGAAVAGAAVAGTAGAALGQHERSSDESPSLHSRELPSNRDLPTPDPAMAPSGNLYSTTTLDPRLLPRIEQPPPRSQLRPDPVNRYVSASSSDAPTPPEKDTPDYDAHDDDSDFFSKPPVPLKPRTPVESEANETLMPPMRPQMLPALSTDTYPNDEENDKLRKEIVKSLSPRPPDAHQDESTLSDEFDETSYPKQGHESTYLPREYDNYWASTSDDQETPDLPTATVEDPIKKEVPQPDAATTQPHEAVDSPVIAPLSPRRPEQASLDAPRPPIQTRFSWEQSNENVNRDLSNDQVSEVSAASSPVHRPQETEEAAVIPPLISSDPQSIAGNQVDPTEPQPQNFSPRETLTKEQNNNATALSATAGAAALTAAVVPAYTAAQQEPKSRRLSLAEEKDPRVSSHPVSPTPPEDEHPARAAQSYFAPSPNQNSPVPAPSTVSPIASPVLRHHFVPPAGYPLTFKEIVKNPTPEERINLFDLTRERFAAMDSGLNDWMATIQTQYPEHADASHSFGGFRTSVPGGTSKSKFGKVTTNNPPPLQQPYYQQYLNASSPTTPSTPVGSRPGPGPGPGGMASGSQQGFSSNSGKMTSQQVSAKGKELLHSAGIFGGKAGKAGKGLLAKGKSKFRGSGDKTSPPPKPKNEQPKQERRTSWGIPLSLSRSSGHPDAPPRQSKEFFPQLQRPRAATGSSNRSSPAPQLPDVTTGPSLGVMSGALPLLNDRQEHQEPASIRQVKPTEVVDEALEARDSMGVPAPIGKHQPTWDPYNATPIAEEEGFQYEHRPTHRQLSSDVNNRQGSLAIPAVGGNSTSERSNSGDTHFYSANEDESEIPRDWVMVPFNPKTKDTIPSPPETQEPQPVTAVETETRKSVDVPVTSILNRPRGSSYEIPSPPTSSKGPAPKPAEPIMAIAAPPRVTPSPPKPVQAEPEKQAGSTSFLPPIRRTSTFGLGFGSRHARPRFPIEDEDDHEQSIPEGAAASTNTAPNPPKLAEEVQAPPPERTSLLQGPGLRVVNNAPTPPLPSSFEMAPPPAQQPASINRATQSPRPLSFVQTSGAGEVLHTPSRSTHQRQGSNDVQLQEPPRYVEPEQVRQEPSMQQIAREQERAMNIQQSPQRPQLVQAGSSEYSQSSAHSQRTVIPQQVMQQQPPPLGPQNQMQRPEQAQRPMGPPPGHQHQHPHLPALVAPRADVLQRPEFRESQVEWRPNRPKAAEPPVVSPAFLKETGGPVPRTNSWEAQRQRGYSGSSGSYTQRPDGQYNERAAWAGSPVPQGPYPQPPSSAQRYPDLFRPGQPGGSEGPRDSADLPAHYYQAPITREAAFLPRAQTNEYQIPGVGPPTEDPRNPGSKRNSGFFKEIGGKLSRASSRDRGNSMSRDGAPPSPARQLSDSRGNEYAESSVASEGEQERAKRRSSFFGNLSRNSTSGLGPPQSRESIIAHNSASRTDLLNSPQPSPTHEGRKRSIFGTSSKDPKDKPNKLVRASTGTMQPPEKKHRFSGLSGMFGKTHHPAQGSPQSRPQATRELSYNERQPLESPRFDAQRPPMNTPPPTQPRAPSQTRQVLQKLTSTSPRPDNKSRRTSSSGLLGGLMGRKSNQNERGSDDSRSQGSSSQARTIRQPLPPAQTYSDLQDDQPRAPPPPQHREIPFQDPSLRVENRGRQASREPQYDSVPIPGGYSLVRGQGATPMSTDYDPRGLNLLPQQMDSRFAQQGPPNGHYHPNGVPTQGPPQQFMNDGRYGPGPRQSPPVVQDPRQLLQPKPHLGALDTYDNYNGREMPRRLSREDLIARSPPKSLEGQQRPYQISLPGGDDDERPPPIDKDPTPPLSTTASRQPRPQHDAIQRLQQPVLRHPESPAGYPLPEDTVFSPVNPGANDMPPPPPPQWPSRIESHRSNASHQTQHERQLSLSTMDADLDRSNTHRTAVSTVSGLSGSRSQSGGAGGGLNVPNRQISDATETDRDRRHLASPSPSPPSPLPGTPERNVSINSNANDIRTTELVAQRSQEDLYNASPRLPKPGHVLPRELAQLSTPANGNANMMPPHAGGGKGKENSISTSAANVNVNRSFSAAVQPTQPMLPPQGYGQESMARAASSSQAQGQGQAQVQSQVQEEKIPYRDGTAGRAELPVASDDDGPPEMSAVSYPGMEWNPYAAGAWDDGFD